MLKPPSNLQPSLNSADLDASTNKGLSRTQNGRCCVCTKLPCSVPSPTLQAIITGCISPEKLLARSEAKDGKGRGVEAEHGPGKLWEFGNAKLLAFVHRVVLFSYTSQVEKSGQWGGPTNVIPLQNFPRKFGNVGTCVDNWNFCLRLHADRCSKAPGGGLCDGHQLAAGPISLRR